MASLEITKNKDSSVGFYIYTNNKKLKKSPVGQEIF